MHWRCKISRLREEQMVASQCDLEASKEQLTLTRARYKIGELNLRSCLIGEVRCTK